MHSLAQKQNQLDSCIQKILALCVIAVKGLYPDARIILYGSQARGQATEQSDLDLLVIVNEELSSSLKNAIHDRLYEIGLQNDIFISAIIKNNSMWELPIFKATGLYNSIQNEGIIVL
jgi:predicted nucleotidyltransferase